MNKIEELETRLAAMQAELEKLKAAGMGNPVDDDGAALRLAVKLGLAIHVWSDETTVMNCKTEEDIVFVEPHTNGDSCAATRLAIVRAAAEIGRSMK